MINKAVFSYFNPDGISNTSGFNTFNDMCASTVLAILTAKKHFEKVELITNDFGKKVFIDRLRLPVQYNLKLNEMNKVSNYFWAYGKIIATSSQNEPFVHIDNDAFLFSGLPKRMLEAELIFQSKEFMDKPGYGWYNVLNPCWKEAKVKPKEIVPITDYAYNCGICGGNNTDFFKLHHKCSSEYIFAPENQELFFNKYKDIIIHQNLFHEQYFIASLIKANNLRDKVEVLADSIEGINRGGISYCHLWGLSKKHDYLIKKMYKRLNSDFPEFYSKVKEFNPKTL
jgi:hypothetical protein